MATATAATAAAISRPARPAPAVTGTLALKVAGGAVPLGEKLVMMVVPGEPPGWVVGGGEAG